MDLANKLAARVELKQEIEDDARALAKKREQLDELDLDIKHDLRETGLDSISKLGYRATIEQAVGTRVTDWSAFYAHVAATEEWHLLERRLTQKPFAELHKQGEAIPGVETYTYDVLQVRKTSGAS